MEKSTVLAVIGGSGVSNTDGLRRGARKGVCNKLGTHLKALAAKDNGVPFHVTLPSPTNNWMITEDVNEIQIEERDPAEVTHVGGVDDSGAPRSVLLTPRLHPPRTTLSTSFTRPSSPR